MKTFFKRYDIDGDGYLMMKDWVLIAENVIKAGNLSGGRADEIRNDYVTVWHKYFKSMTLQGKTTCDMLILNIKKSGKVELEKSLITQYNTYFDVIDSDQDSLIQLQEFINFFHAIGISEEIAKEAFKGLDTNQDGVLSREEFISAVLGFFLREEPNDSIDLFYGSLISD